MEDETVHTSITVLKEQVIELKKENARLTCENKSRGLLESVGLKSDPIKIRALCALESQEEKEALLETWKPLLEAKPAIRIQPRSSQIEVKPREKAAPVTPTVQEFVALLR